MQYDLDLALELMADFSERTGITGVCDPHRYLWTDAHAVCNYLSLWHATGDSVYLGRAKELVSQVHNVLGRHRSDDPRQGWISNMSEALAQQHPTAAGLRIGKAQPERGLHEPLNERAEWERDGQYFHYLTRWAHALLVMSRNTNDAQYHRWAIELMIVAHRQFQSRGHPKGLYWKMRIDLSAPLVSNTSPTDALDGAATCLTLCAQNSGRNPPDLIRATKSLLQMYPVFIGHTRDPLGLGGLLFDACRLLQTPASEDLGTQPMLLDSIFRAALEGIQEYFESPALRQPPEERLAFRELGLVIGLEGIVQLPRLQLLQGSDRLSPAGRDLMQCVCDYHEKTSDLRALWREPTQHHTASWLAHEDINAVMLASVLVPGALITCQ